MSCGALLACGSTTHSSGESSDPDPSASAGSSVAGASGLGGAAGFGGRSLTLGGSSTRGGGAGAVSVDVGGEQNLGGAESPTSDPGPVYLCLYDEDIPDNWSGAGGNADTGSRACAVGVLGPFTFDGCRFELLATMAFNVDPFVGGHSHCCYSSKLLRCP